MKILSEMTTRKWMWNESQRWGECEYEYASHEKGVKWCCTLWHISSFRSFILLLTSRRMESITEELESVFTERTRTDGKVQWGVCCFRFFVSPCLFARLFAFLSFPAVLGLTLVVIVVIVGLISLSGLHFHYSLISVSAHSTIVWKEFVVRMMWVSSVFLLSFPRPPPLTPLRRDRSASLVVIMSPFFARRRRRAARPWFWLRCLLAGRWMMLVDEQHFFTAAITSPLKKQNNIATHSPCHWGSRKWSDVV